MSETGGINRSPEDGGMGVKKDYTIDVLRLLDQLIDQIERVRTFAGVTFGFRRDDLVMQIEKIRAHMPRDLKDLANAARDRDRMLDDARAEADEAIAQAQRKADEILTQANNESRRILEEARIQQERMIEESEVLKLATAQSEELRAASEKEARQLKKGADQYAFETLSQLESILDKMKMTVERGKNELDDVAPVRERVKN